MKNMVRALLLLPFIVPTVLSTVAWLWMLDPAFSVVNRMLVALGWPKPGPSWLGDPTLAMVSIIIINTWRGLPFYGITLLAGLQTVPAELYEAASIDGAGGWERFRYVTLPLLRPIILIVTLFSVIFTFADFQLIYVLTHGGPANATQLFATYAFDIAMGAGQLGLGASVALAMLPALALLDRGAHHLSAEGVMVSGEGRIRQAVRVWLPIGFFLVLALFPFYWMAITSIKPNSELYNKNVMPLIVHAPTLKHYIDLLTQSSFLLWTWNTMLVAVVATAISLVLGTMLAYPLARMRFAGASLISMTIAAIYLVPQPLLFIPLADVINRLNLGNTLTSVMLTYPDHAGAVLRLAAARLLQDRPEGARGGRPHRWRKPPADDVEDLPAAVHARLHLRGHLRLHAVPERVSVRVDLPDQELGAHRPGRRHRRADPRRRLLLGATDGGRPARLDPGGDDLLVLRRALCRRPDRGFGQGVTFSERYRALCSKLVMPGLEPGIHVCLCSNGQRRRGWPGQARHDEGLGLA